MKRLFALLVPLLLTGGPAFAAAPSPPHGGRSPKPGRHASRDRQPAQRLPVDVVIGSFTPTYLKSPAQTLRLSGELRNRADSPYQQLSVRLRYGNRPVSSRGELDTYADGKGADPPLFGPQQAVPAGLQAGGRQPWRLALAAKQMRLPRWGVYPVTVEVLNAGAVVGQERTFITYYPKGTLAQKTNLSWIWPVVDQPHRSSDTTFLDDRLERELGSGRLTHLLGAAARTPTPITWLVDPALVDDAAAMTGKNGYTVKGSVRRPQNIAATKWLELLRGATGQKRLIATPYADPDVVALAHAGMAKDIGAATKAGLARLGTRLVGPSTSVAVPPDGIADQQTLAALAGAGAESVVLSSTVLPDMRAQITPDPVAQRTVGGKKVKLIAYDETLHRMLGANTNVPGGRLVAERRFLAETAMITAEAPSTPRTVVVMPPRRWNPDQRFARNLLTYSRSAPWLRSVALKDVEALKPGARVLQPVKTTAGLSRRHLKQVRTLSRRIRRFTMIMRPPVSAFTLGVARAESSAWSDQTRRGAALRTALDTELTDAAGKIRVLNEQITLLGRSAQIPITISNGLTGSTVQVKLHAYSQNDTRLRVTSEDRVLTLEPGHKEQVTLFMKAAANGPAYVNLELLAPDNRPFSDTRVLRVNATAYGRTALLITGVSLAVLFLGVGIRVIRRRGEGAEETSA